ncbi:MAG: hypothetical protein KGH72_00145 [Candidatus Micrarchaeota archaeon]|nr:hypothetical protein [Candidatus Micrarchaeota archaeon]
MIRNVSLTCAASKASAREEAIARSLEDCLRIREPERCGPTRPDCIETAARQVSDVLFASRKTRIGCSPTEEQRHQMSERVARWIEVGAPIQVSTLWSATKGYGQVPDRVVADVADLLGLRRFEELHQRVTGIYAPGISIGVIREDITERILAGKIANLGMLTELYSRSLDGICDALGISGHISFIDESRILGRRGVTAAAFIERAAENAGLIFDYWIASSRAPNSSKWHTLQEYKRLQEAGWTGTMPQAMRDHYIDRVSTEHPDATTEEKIGFVCKYLGTALARYQFKLFGGSTMDLSGNVIAPIKTGFVPYPPGTDPSLGMCRVEYRLKDGKSSNNYIPPWVGFGFLSPLENGGYDTKVIGLNAFRSIPREAIEPFSVRIGCGESGKEQKIEADILSTALR